MGNPPTPAPSPSCITERYAAVYYRSGDIVGGKKRSEGEREGRGGECGKEEMVVNRANVERGKRDGHTERERKKEWPGERGREGKRMSREIGKSTRSGKGTNRRDDLSVVRARARPLFLRWMCMCVCVRACASREYMSLAKSRRTHTYIYEYSFLTGITHAHPMCARLNSRHRPSRIVVYGATSAISRAMNNEKACDATSERTRRG